MYKSYLGIAYLYSKFFKKIIRGKSIINSKIEQTAVINSGSSIVNSFIGAYSYCGYDCEIVNCKIGKFCSISDNVFIGGSEHPMNWVSTSPVFQNVKHSGPKKRFALFDLKEPILTTIGNDVWIGHNVSIKQGVNIGDGAVIGMGAVVTKDVEPYSIIVGCPAKIVKYRFEKNIINDLLKLQWWNYSEEELKKVAAYIQDPIEFIIKSKELITR